MVLAFDLVMSVFTLVQILVREGPFQKTSQHDVS